MDRLPWVVLVLQYLEIVIFCMNVQIGLIGLFCHLKFLLCGR